MRKYGDKKHRRSKVEGHQNCADCSPEVKNAKRKAREEGKHEVEVTWTEMASWKEGS